jgi:hypothetical protein
MTESKLWAAEALEEFPEELRERAVAYLLEQGEKFRVLQKLVEEGLADVEAGRVSDWDPDEIWAMAEEMADEERKQETAREAGE